MGYTVHGVAKSQTECATNANICSKQNVSHFQSLSLGPLVSVITGMEQDLPRRAQLV